MYWVEERQHTCHKLLESETDSHSVVSDSATTWTVACQAPLFMEFFRQEYWSGLPFPSSGDLPNPGMEPRSAALQADSLPSEPPGKPWICSTVLQLITFLKSRCVKELEIKLNCNTKSSFFN